MKSRSDKIIELEDAAQLNVYKRYPIALERGRDVWVWTASGRRFLDLYGGHAVALLGHCHPRIVEAVRKQAGRLLFYSNLAYNSVRARASRLLVDFAPEGLDRVFFVNSGAEANENAIKLARKITGRPTLLSFEGSFHGRTLAAISATGFERMRQTPPKIPGHVFAPFGDLEAVERLMAQKPPAAVLTEPIQSMAGVCCASGDFFRGLRHLCDRHGAFLIYDEIQTGFGRTGQAFYAPSHGVVPDMMTLAKGIAGGLPMGAVLVSESVARQVAIGDLGSTFGGGPLACAALEAALLVLREGDLAKRVETLSRALKPRLLALPSVREVLGRGFLLGIRFDGAAAPYKERLFERHILTGLSEDKTVLRLLPPLTLKPPEIDLFLAELEAIPESSDRQSTAIQRSEAGVARREDPGIRL